MRDRRLLVYSDAHPSAATLQIRLVEPLRRLGFEIIDAHDCDRQAGTLRRTVQQDVEAVIIHRAVRKRCRAYGVMLEAARDCAKPVIHDTDDLLIRVCPTHPDYPVYQAKVLYALKGLVDSHYVVASTQTLADGLSAFHPRIAVIPNELPASLWKEICLRKTAGSPSRQTDEVTIGYVASYTHQPDLELVEGALLAVLRRYQGRARFLSVGVPLTGRLKSHPAADQWMPPREVQKSYPKFASFAADLPIDVGIAPLVDNPFNRCKSDIKFQEYSALGIPTVCSDSPPYRDCVTNDVNGYLAARQSDWERSLGRLVESAKLRRRIGDTAAGEILSQWESPPFAVRWNEVLERAARLARSRNTEQERERIAPVVDAILAYQTNIERRWKRTLEYQVGRTIGRLIRKLAG